MSFPEDDPQCTQTREVHYLDADAAQQRMQMSVDNGWLGVSLFAFSYEDDAVWDRIAEINATLETIPADNDRHRADDRCHNAAPPTDRDDDHRLGFGCRQPMRASERSRFRCERPSASGGAATCGLRGRETQ